MLGAIAAVVAAHYLVAFGQAVVGVTTPALLGDSGPMTLALLIVWIVWWVLREGRAVREDLVARLVGASVGVLVLLVLAGTASALLSPVGSIPLRAPPVEVLSVVTALGFVLSALGSVESLTQAAVDLRAASDSKPAASGAAGQRLRHSDHRGARVSVRGGRR